MDIRKDHACPYCRAAFSLIDPQAVVRAMQENWPRIKFHALREHAGLVFQQRMEG